MSKYAPFGQKTQGPGLYDVHTLVQAGIDPKTGLPIKAEGGGLSITPSNIRAPIRMDLAKRNAVEAINRYKWYNLPNGLTGQLLETMLYTKGQLAFFYLKANNTFYILPYCLDGKPDVYGRFLHVSPVQWRGATTQTAQGKDTPFIPGMKLDVIYDFADAVKPDIDLSKACVILHDYTPFMGSTITPQESMMYGILDMMADVLPIARTALVMNSGIKGMKVGSPDEASACVAAANEIYHDAINTIPYAPIVGTQEFQDLTSGGNTYKPEDYLMTLQALDSYRLSMLGLKNGGIMQKKAHMLQAEQEMNNTGVDLVMQDGLTLRQHFCDLINAIFGLAVWCEPAETVLGADRNLDGALVDEQDQSGQMPGDQPMEVAQDE